MKLLLKKIKHWFWKREVQKAYYEPKKLILLVGFHRHTSDYRKRHGLRRDEVRHVSQFIDLVGMHGHRNMQIRKIHNWFKLPDVEAIHSTLRRLQYEIDDHKREYNERINEKNSP